MRDWLRAWLAVLLGWLLVLAGVGGLAIVWLSSDPVDAAQIVGTVVALVMMVAGGCTVLWQWSRSGIAERRAAVARLVPESRKPGQLPRLGQVDLTYLGVRVPHVGQSASIDQLPYASRRVLDPQLRAALLERRFILVHGPSAAGKSRSTAETARALYGDRPVLVPPLRPGALTELLTAKAVPAGTVVWLDDVDRHVGAGVDAGVVQSLLAVDRVLVVATIRAAAYEQFKPQGELKPPGSDVIDLAKQLHGLVTFTDWDEPDREQAARQYSGYLDVVDALNNGRGLGEHLVAGPELVERVETGAPPAEGVAVVKATTDWYRAGMTRPAPVNLVRKLYPLYLPPDDASLLDRFDDALQWACTPVSGARLVTHRTDGSGLAVHDYYLDHVWEHSLEAVPSQAWDLIADELADMPADLSVVGIMLYLSGDSTRAERLFRTAAAGERVAMFSLGFVLNERGELREAERWYRAAAEAGLPEAMHNLGILLADQGQLVEAEHWYRTSAAAGNSNAMHSLGIVLAGRGDLVEAERWYRAAAEAGDAGAMHKLGVVLNERGDLVEAEGWYRAAGDAGIPSKAMHNLGLLLAERGEVVEAEHWYRASAEAGVPSAMNNLGILLAGRGDLAEAERWYRAAADADHPGAMNNIGVLAAGRGDVVQAERWYRAAAIGGDTLAMHNLGFVLDERGELAEAEHWYRAAADADHPGAMFNIGVLLVGRAEVEEAEHWFRGAAEAGITDAMNNLGVLLAGRGDLAEAERWYRAAADADHPGAIHNLEVLLRKLGSSGA